MEKKFYVISKLKSYANYEEALIAAKKALQGPYAVNEAFIVEDVAIVAKPLPECVVTKF